MNVIEGGLVNKNAKISIISSRFNRIVNNNLLLGALDALKRIGQVPDTNITVVWVPGAYELPLTAQVLAKNHGCDAIIALGTVIRGHTPHFEFISKECSSGLLKISIQNDLPIGFGLLTTDNIDQAVERSGIKLNNKGTEAALAVLEMISILKFIRK